VSQADHFFWTLAERTTGMSPSVIRETLKLSQREGIVSFAGGLPSPKTFPIDALREACIAVFRESGHAALQYDASEGFGPLRELVAAALPWRVQPEQVIITSGSQQALDLIAKVLLDPGAEIVVERPTYLGALQTFTLFQPAVLSVGGGVDGVDVDELRQKGSGARFIYALPSFQNPTGRTMNEAGRTALCNVAADIGLPVIEDDPYGDLWFETPPPSPLAARNPDGCIYVGSFSKILAPGLRLGFLVAPKALQAKLLQAKQAADLHTPGFNQRLVSRLMADGFFSTHIPSIRSLYKVQRDAMLGALEKEMQGLDVHWSRPGGGMFVWMRLPTNLTAEALLPLAVSEGVAFVPGAPFYSELADHRTLRLSYVTPTPQEIALGVTALARAIRATVVTNSQ
jgi:2-aminoadipate transaminase